MQVRKTDIVVVGAGPAGSLAARTAAECGAGVILLEEHPVVGSPVSCAEGLSLSGIRDAGLEPVPPYVCQRITAAHIIPPNKKRIELTGENWVGFNLNRAEFDKALGDNAVKAGAELMTRTSAVGVVREGKKVVGVRAVQNGEPVEIRAKVTIGADGYHSIIRRSAGLKRFFDDVVSCAQYTLTGLDLEVTNINEFYLGGVFAPGGYAWIFPKSRTTANVGLGVRKLNDLPSIDYLNDFIMSDPRLRNGVKGYRCGGVTPTTGLFDQITDDGLMLVGDAAGMVVPCTGAGIHCGLEGGKMAAREAVKAIQEDDVSGRRLNRFRLTFDKYWGKRLKDSGRVVEMLDKFADDDISMLADVITNDEIVALATGDGASMALAKIVRRSPGKIMRLIAAYLA